MPHCPGEVQAHGEGWHHLSQCRKGGMRWSGLLVLAVSSEGHGHLSTAIQPQHAWFLRCLVVTRAMDFSSDLSYSRTMDTDMAISSSPGPNNTRALDDRTGLSDQLGPGKGTTLGHLHGHGLRVRSQASVCPLVAKWPTDININSSYGTRHGPRKQPELRCHHVPS